MIENRNRGTTSWQLAQPADARQIEGYASQTSVQTGGDIELYVNTGDASYTMAIYRLGWYGGTGARMKRKPMKYRGIRQPGADDPVPCLDPESGMIDCRWTRPILVHIPRTWLAGIYLAKLHGNDSDKESYIVFVVRDERPADLVFQQSVTTYQAYNPWPGWHPLPEAAQEPRRGYVGKSAYEYQNSEGVRAVRISFNRPYGRGLRDDTLHGVGAGDLLTHDYDEDPSLGGNGIRPMMGSGLSAWEYCMLRWLEREGYDVTYITNLDTHEELGRLLRGKAFLSVGHDEYWSRQMTDHVVQARDHGVHLGFFSGNYIYWPITFESGNRVMRVPKTATFRKMGQSEQLIAGAHWDETIANEDIVVSPNIDLGHWVFAGTGLGVGDTIPGLIGYEYQTAQNREPENLEAPLISPAPERRPYYTMLKEIPGGKYCSTQLPPAVFTSCVSGRSAQDTCGFCEPGKPRGPWTMTIYRAATQTPTWVFSAGTVQWSWGLDDYGTGLARGDGVNNGPPIRKHCGYSFRWHPASCRHPAVEAITRNVLERFLSPTR